jgi:hypothetical protein
MFITSHNAISKSDNYTHLSFSGHQTLYPLLNHSISSYILHISNSFSWELRIQVNMSMPNNWYNGQQANNSHQTVAHNVEIHIITIYVALLSINLDTITTGSLPTSPNFEIVLLSTQPSNEPHSTSELNYSLLLDLGHFPVFWSYVPVVFILDYMYLGVMLKHLRGYMKM